MIEIAANNVVVVAEMEIVLVDDAAVAVGGDGDGDDDAEEEGDVALQLQLAEIIEFAAEVLALMTVDCPAS